ncbi:MFS transporter [Parahaliea maris]|nr:MFS transporter [Parahaliea maris]
MSRLIAFSSPSATIAALGLPIIIILPPLYAELGLSLTVVGSIFMLTRFFDVATDPVFGVLGDRINTRWGRRRTALVVSVPVLLLGVYLVFFPGESASATGLLVALLIMYVGWTMFSLSHTAWASELSTDYDVRSRIMGTVQFLGLLGALTVLALPTILDLLAIDASMRDRAAIMGAFVLLSLPLVSGAALFSTPEPPRRQHEHAHWREALRAFVQNRPLRRLLLADLLCGIQGGINGAVHFFFIGNVLAMPEHATTFLVQLFLVGLLVVPVFVRLSYKIGKHQALAIAVLTTSIGTAGIFFVPPESFWLTFVIYIFIATNTGAREFLMRSIMADVIDQDRLETGEYRSALYYSMLTLTAKIGLAASVGIIYPMLDMVGFDPNGVNDEATITGVRILVATSPTVLLFITAAIMFRFPLDRQSQMALRAELETRR